MPRLCPQHRPPPRLSTRRPPQPSISRHTIARHDTLTPRIGTETSTTSEEWRGVRRHHRDPQGSAQQVRGRPRDRPRPARPLPVHRRWATRPTTASSRTPSARTATRSTRWCCCPSRCSPACIVEARPVGMFRMVDEAGGDDKVLCVPAGDPRWDHIQDIGDVSRVRARRRSSTSSSATRTSSRASTSRAPTGSAAPRPRPRSPLVPAPEGRRGARRRPLSWTREEARPRRRERASSTSAGSASRPARAAPRLRLRVLHPLQAGPGAQRNLLPEHTSTSADQRHPAADQEHRRHRVGEAVLERPGQPGSSCWMIELSCRTSPRGRRVVAAQPCRQARRRPGCALQRRRPPPAGSRIVPPPCAARRRCSGSSC